MRFVACVMAWFVNKDWNNLPTISSWQRVTKLDQFQYQELVPTMLALKYMITAQASIYGISIHSTEARLSSPALSVLFIARVDGRFVPPPLGSHFFRMGLLAITEAVFILGVSWHLFPLLHKHGGGCLGLLHFALFHIFTSHTRPFCPPKLSACQNASIYRDRKMQVKYKDKKLSMFHNNNIKWIIIWNIILHNNNGMNFFQSETVGNIICSNCKLFPFFVILIVLIVDFFPPKSKGRSLDILLCVGFVFILPFFGGWGINPFKQTHTYPQDLWFFWSKIQQNTSSANFSETNGNIHGRETQFHKTLFNTKNMAFYTISPPTDIIMQVTQHTLHICRYVCTWIHICIYTLTLYWYIYDIVTSYMYVYINAVSNPPKYNVTLI